MTAAVTKMPRERMTRQGDVAHLVETVLTLPNTATIGEILVNCRMEAML